MNGFKHSDAFWVQVAGCGDPHASLNHRTEVGDNVSKHVTCHNDIEPLRIFHHPHCCRIDKGIFFLDIRVIFPYLVKDAAPQIVCVGEDVCFVAERQRIFLVALFGELKRIAHAAFYAFVSINHFLNRDFITCATF